MLLKSKFAALPPSPTGFTSLESADHLYPPSLGTNQVGVYYQGETREARQNSYLLLYMGLQPMSLAMVELL